MLGENEESIDWRRRLLWIDAMSGLTAGVIVLALCRWLSLCYGLPWKFIMFMGVVNLTYGCYSLWLARLRVRPMVWVALLPVANAAWTIACFGFAGFFSQTANVLGLVHLMGEGVYVGTLASLEWRWRGLLVAP